MNNYPSVVSFLREIRSGSSLPLVVSADDGKTYIMKLTGAGEGVHTLIAEWTASHLAAAAGIPVLEPVILNFNSSLMPPGIDPEITELAQRSNGLNLGTVYIPDSRSPKEADFAALSPEMCNTIFLTDLLLLNIDRTRKNPNMLVQNSQIFCFDYSASFTVNDIVNGRNTSGGKLLQLMRRHLFYNDDISGESIDAVCSSFSYECVHAILTAIPAAWQKCVSCDDISLQMYNLLSINNMLTDRLEFLRSDPY